MTYPINIKLLGPLAALVGTWEGDKGEDRAPSDDRGVETNKFRERMLFVPISQIDNHEQRLFGLRYSTTAWRIGEPDPFHEEVGYWLWEPATLQILRCFIVPRGVTVIAGGKAQPDAKEFSLRADLGSATFGICSNPFLDREFKTVAYDLKVTLMDPTRFSYEETTHLKIKGQEQIFSHRDANVLSRVAGP